MCGYFPMWAFKIFLIMGCDPFVLHTQIFKKFKKRKINSYFLIASSIKNTRALSITSLFFFFFYNIFFSGMKVEREGFLLVFSLTFIFVCLLINLFFVSLIYFLSLVIYHHHHSNKIKINDDSWKWSSISPSWTFDQIQVQFNS